MLSLWALPEARQSTNQKTTIKDETKSCPQNEALKLCSLFHSMNMGFDSFFPLSAAVHSHHSSASLSTTNGAASAAHLTAPVYSECASWCRNWTVSSLLAFDHRTFSHYNRHRKCSHSDKLLWLFFNFFSILKTFHSSFVLRYVSRYYEWWKKSSFVSSFLVSFRTAFFSSVCSIIIDNGARTQ